MSIVALACAGDRPVAALAEVAMADQIEPGGRPDPAEANTPAEFVEAMARLKRWTGWGFRRLEKQAAAAGRVLPRSTLTHALSRPALPREELIASFVIACGGDEAEVARWIAERRRLAAEPDPIESPAPETSLVIVAPSRSRLRTAVVGVFALVATAGIAWHLSRSGAPTILVATVPAPTQAPATSIPTTTAAASTTPLAPTSTSGRATPPPASTATTPPPPATTITAPPITVAPQPMPACADATYRHVGTQRVQLPAYGGSADCVLSYGATGEGVKALQSALINCNNAVYVTMTGMYDQKTWEAIAFIQSATGTTPADGIYRPETRSTLFWNHDGGTTRECAHYAGT